MIADLRQDTNIAERFDQIPSNEYPKCIEFIGDFASKPGIKIGKTANTVKIADKLLLKIHKRAE